MYTPSFWRKHVGRATKQVIIMRTDLQMRKGKMVAQGAHASLAVLTNLRGEPYPAVLKEWLANSFTKICVGVNNEAELIKLYDKAITNGILASFIVDNGATEFHGIPTATCAAIGPGYSEDIDKITGGLKLL